MQTLTPYTPWWRDDILTLAQLLDIIATINYIPWMSPAVIPGTQPGPTPWKLEPRHLQKHIYVIAGKVALRLFNTRERLATVPALLPSDKAFKYPLGLTTNPEVYYHNIKPLKHDYKNGKRTTNAKTDLIIHDPVKELLDLGLDIPELFNDNNSTKL